MLLASASTALLTAPHPQASALTLRDDPSLLLVGPAGGVASMSGVTAVRLGAGKEAAAALAASGLLGADATLPASARLLVVDEAVALAPLQGAAQVRSSVTDGLEETILLFPQVAGRSSVDVVLPGLGVVEAVALLPADLSPFRLA